MAVTNTQDPVPLEELAALRRRIQELEAARAGRNLPEAELGGAQRRFEHLLAVSPAIIYATNVSGDFGCTYVSENIRTIMGFAPEEMTTDAKCWPDRLHPGDAARVFNELSPLIERGGGTVEYRFRHKDGHYVWIQDSFKVIYEEPGEPGSPWPRNEGRPKELVGAWADITSRKLAEQNALKANEELQETKRSLTRLIESSPDAIISTDREGRIVLFNEGAEALLGYRAEEVIGRAVTLLYGGEAGANEVLREMRKRGGTVSGFDSVLWAKNGASIPVLISASVLLDDDGTEIGTVGFATDLRDRKSAQEELQKAYDDLERRVESRTAELKEARGRLQYLLTVTPGIMYTNQGAGGFACTFVSRNVDPIMGFSEWEMLEDPEFWVKRLHPEDATRVFEEMAPLVELGGGSFEYRFRHRDGHYVWIQDTFKVVRDDSGRPSEIVGSWADITHRKQVERALGERMALMNDLENLVAASPAVIYTTKATDDFACTFVSENLKSTMGYAPWEMREDPKFWSKRIHPEDAQRVFSEIASVMESGEGSIEYRFRHRRGHYLWIHDTFKVMRDKEGKPRELVGSWADISDRKKIEGELKKVASDVERRNRFIRETFGRYLTDEVVDSLLDNPGGLQIGGEKRKITMLMADLRGFTSISERLAPKWVVTILNRYLTTMVKIIKRYDGTIDEFIGDAIFVLFGAPVWNEDDAQRAVACAVEMQLAMAGINEQNKAEGLPELEMGIGIHTGQVVVGNIGAPERMKYGVVGSHVNLTSRIQAFTTGGQILASEATRRDVGPMLKIGKQVEVKAKGIAEPLSLGEVVGIGGPFKLSLTPFMDSLVALKSEILVSYSVVEGVHLIGSEFKGRLTKASLKRGEARLETTVPDLSNVEMRLTGSDGLPVPGVLYCKVFGAALEGGATCTVRFTSMSPEIEVFLCDRLGINLDALRPGQVAQLASAPSSNEQH